jgi:two-component system sensor histidine kinase KdpD
VVLFFLAAVLVALVGGLGPALLAAAAGGLLLNYFLTPRCTPPSASGRT